MSTHSSRFSSTVGAAPGGAAGCCSCCDIIRCALPRMARAACRVLDCGRFSHGLRTSAMTSALFTWIFLALLTLNVGLKYWLAARQIHYVQRRADSVPEQFAGQISLEAHRRAAAY